MRKELVNKDKIIKLNGNKKKRKYNMKRIYHSTIYIKKLVGHVLELCYLVFYKSYSEEKYTLKPILTIYYFKKLISLFHKNYLSNLIVTFKVISNNMARASA